METSSTEHFFAATAATLSSRRRASARVREKPDSTIGKRGGCLKEASRASCMPPRRLGVAYPLAEKSIRIRRTSSLVNCSRQKGQTGLRRGNVFSTILWQQEEHRTWPGEWHGGSEIFHGEEEYDHTARYGMGDAMRAVLFCAHVADRTRTERQHEGQAD